VPRSVSFSFSCRQKDEPTYVRYAPNPNAPGFNPNAKQRVIELVQAQVDPMEPPKHKHKKVPRGPPEDPVPVLHSPPRKVSVQDQELWKIPPCVSNWKNAKGFTIALDKRLAADGRGLQEVRGVMLVRSRALSGCRCC
jgi:SNW domain-containing protein 1